MKIKPQIFKAIIDTIGKLRAIRLGYYWSSSKEHIKMFEKELWNLKKVYQQENNYKLSKEDELLFDSELVAFAKERGIKGEIVDKYLNMLEQHMPMEFLIKQGIEKEENGIREKITNDLAIAKLEDENSFNSKRGGTTTKFNIFRSVIGLSGLVTCGEMRELFNIKNDSECVVPYEAMLSFWVKKFRINTIEEIDKEVLRKIYEEVRKNKIARCESMLTDFCDIIIENVGSTRGAIIRNILNLEHKKRQIGLLASHFMNIRDSWDELAEKVNKQSLTGETINILTRRAEKQGYDKRFIEDYVKYAKDIFKDGKIDNNYIEGIIDCEKSNIKEILIASKEKDLEGYCKVLGIKRKNLINAGSTSYDTDFIAIEQLMRQTFLPNIDFGDSSTFYYAGDLKKKPDYSNADNMSMLIEDFLGKLEEDEVDLQLK